ncbi:DUF6193 family natural product biosynthesis protein [Streptomyces sp. CS090A]|uniref:DUF6193 family natural product biosynthesis protein n=1 Tax=Streptomyces sp. CS090A TaxID=2162710 RepID=UPI001EF50ADB|nr:DUF6193 family natural product biosynthesis protein [Streptomyces sp. CS090A]
MATEWSAVLSFGPDRIAPAVLRAAYTHPPLRQLYPMVRHGVLYLSRCTQWPWTRDVGTAHPLGQGWLPSASRVRQNAPRRGRHR